MTAMLNSCIQFNIAVIVESLNECDEVYVDGALLSDSIPHLICYQMPTNYTFVPCEESWTIEVRAKDLGSVGFKTCDDQVVKKICADGEAQAQAYLTRSEEHTSELQ